MIRSVYATLAATALALVASSAVSSAAWTASVSGRVVDVKSLAPVSGAMVSIYTTSGITNLGTAKSDAQGNFVINGLRGGNYRLDFQKHGYTETVVAGVYVRPGERLVEAAPIAMYPHGVPVPKAVGHNPCGSVVDPAQTADVYIVCSGD
jgi:hypothetical protein